MDVSSLVQSVKGDVITPDHPEYSAALTRWAKNAERRAAAVVFVKDEEDVAATIKFAKEHKLLFAIRGGGHNAGGASSAEDGIVVDLSRYLNKVRVNSEAKLGYIGGGCVWKDVDEEAIKYGLATVGGTVNHTGVGGLTLGGGFGWLSSRHGLTIDNLRQATVVTADGSILTANENENAELFWGIRGGGSNFGVVTEFVLQLYPQRETVFAGPIIYTMDKVEEVTAEVKKWWPTITEDEGVIQAISLHAEKPVMAIFVFYNGTEEEGRARFKPFFDIAHIMDGAKMIPYEKLNTLHNPKVDHGECYYLTGSTQREPSSTSIREAMERLSQVASEGYRWIGIMVEYHGLDKVNAVSPTATAFRRPRTPNIAIAISWSPNSDDGTRNQKARQLGKELDRIFTKADAIPGSVHLGYINYDMDPDAPREANDEKARNGFGENYARLQKVKKQYDPDNFFNRWFPITPAR